MSLVSTWWAVFKGNFGAAWNILLSKLPEIVSDGLKCQRPSENNEHNTEEILCLNKKPFFKRLGRLCRPSSLVIQNRLICVPSMATMQRNAITLWLFWEKVRWMLWISNWKFGVLPQGNERYFAVANHVSWLDIFAMSAVYPEQLYCETGN